MIVQCGHYSRHWIIIGKQLCLLVCSGISKRKEYGDFLTPSESLVKLDKDNMTQY